MTLKTLLKISLANSYIIIINHMPKFYTYNMSMANMEIVDLKHFYLSYLLR